MDTSYDHIGHSISLEQLHVRAPAAFASRPYVRTSPSYVFISTSELVRALLGADYVLADAKQTRARGDRGAYARHMIRFRHLRDSVTLVDAVPELILINSHDASSAYELRAGLYRPVCTNGLLARLGDMDIIHVPHRGDVLAQVVEGARRITSRFAEIGDIVVRMARTELDAAQRERFAQAALAIRYPNGGAQYPASLLLGPRREIDQGSDLWRIYNVAQEHLMRGGLPGRTVEGRRTTSRAIRAIRSDVTINSALWDLAMRFIRG